MSEELQTRTEHSRSIEDAEKFRAIDTLKEVGLLVPVSELETYHGRVGTAGEIAKWAVDPSFANGSNDSGNNNVNSRPTLYTGEQEVAKDFAMERGRAMIRPKYNKVFEDRVANYTPEERQEWLDRENKSHQDWYDGIDPAHKNGYEYLLDESGKLKPKTLDDLRTWSESRRLEDETPEDEQKALWKSAAEGMKAEVHEIVTADTDATVLDFSFDETKLDDEDRAKYQKALKVLALPITEGSPVSFDDRDKVQPFVAAVQQAKKTGYLLSSDVTELAVAANVDERVALQLASAFNTRHIAQVRPSYLVSELIKCPTDIFAASLEIDGEKQDVPINLEYVQRFLREAHIVGVKQSISSATLNRDITSVSFFDLEKTITDKGLEAERKDTWQRLGGMATALSQINQGEAKPKQPLLHMLSDVYAKPDKLVAAAKDVEGYDAIFKGDAGNWEGFTLAEHTETVLRNFDESFAENLPVELLAPMRLAILSHDVGKPIAAAQGEKHKQMEYNVTQANDFLSKLGVDDKLKDLLIAIIGEGEELAFQIEVRGAGEPAQAAMRELATKTLRNFYDSESITDEQITGFTEMCKMLQVCDGGAYTSMAITRPTVKGSGRYRNAPSFNNSFAQPVGFGKRTIRLREQGVKAAESDLTPKGSAEASRLRINHAGAGRKAPKLTS
jgi:hypothetical protein